MNRSDDDLPAMPAPPLARRLERVGDDAHAPELPVGLRLYVLGDVHGRADLLEVAFAAIDADLAARPVARSREILVGDLIDRGPASRAVIDGVLARRTAREVVVLRGNHEGMLLDALADPAHLPLWLHNGGAATLRSYGIDPGTQREPGALREAARVAIPRAHLDFLADLPDRHRCGDYLFVHAGIRPGRDLAAQSAKDLCWIREPFLSSDANHGVIVVHGHTPVPRLEVRANRIGIDTGAVATGMLTCLVLEGSSIRYREIRRSPGRA